MSASGLEYENLFFFSWGENVNIMQTYTLLLGVANMK